MVSGTAGAKSQVMFSRFIVVTLLALPLSWWLTGQVRRYALAHSVLDIPTNRSSHSTPQPRGGGVAIVVVVLAGLLPLRLLGELETGTVIAISGGGILVAAIGWLDDHRSIPAVVRAAVHFGAAAWALTWLGGLEGLHIGPHELYLGTAGAILAAVGIVWCTNLYNFMDGIDGIAGGEAVSAGLLGSVMLVTTGNEGLATVALLIAASSGGFLFWNWPPARIFMGDVGSGFLGFTFCVLALSSEIAGSAPLAAWILLLGVFFFDATTTLVRRVLQRERWYDAHHSHAYQRAVQSGMSHSRVTGIVLCVNFFLGVLAVVGLATAHLLTSVIIGFLVLSLLYLGVERLRPMR